MRFQSVFWNLAFRPLFLAAPLLSIFALMIWVLTLNGVVALQTKMPSILLHVHEMIFGFAVTIAMGFLLTAVQTWTGLRSMHGSSLALLCGLWLLARLLIWQTLWVEGSAAVLALLLVQAMWWGIFIFHFSRLLLRAQSRRNYLFIPLLSAIAVLNLLFIYMGSNGYVQQALHLSQSSILFFTVLVSIVAGRIIPMFTRNGCGQVGIETNIKSTNTTDKFLLGFSLLGALSFLVDGFIELFYQPAWILIFVGYLHLFRQGYWSPTATTSIPLLWSLHLAYLCMAAGIILIGISRLTDFLSTGDAFHLLTIGTLGGMILAMISRVSLGHTGRPLKVNSQMSIAFLLIFIAAAMRLIFPIIHLPLLGWNLSVLCWCLAFAFFLRNYFPILTKA